MGDCFSIESVVAEGVEVLASSSDSMLLLLRRYLNVGRLKGRLLLMLWGNVDKERTPRLMEVKSGWQSWPCLWRWSLLEPRGLRRLGWRRSFTLPMFSLFRCPFMEVEEDYRTSLSRSQSMSKVRRQIRPKSSTLLRSDRW